jgi:hypothetical protein
MNTKDNLQEDSELHIILRLGTRDVPLICKAKDEESLRTAAKQFNYKYSLYSEQYSESDERDLLGITGLSFAYQLLTQSSIDKTVSI